MPFVLKSRTRNQPGREVELLGRRVWVPPGGSAVLEGCTGGQVGEAERQLDRAGLAGAYRVDFLEEGVAPEPVAALPLEDPAVPVPEAPKSRRRSRRG